ncbi:hypothetical protein SAMN05446935_7538 [Burkholderia sp. YR290]|nr:hypothetical protein SAMN05446935_7538 [Burkholderia sp. YR290]
MSDNICARCGTVTSPHDVVSVASGDGAFRSLCSRCFNTGMAHLAKLNAFEHPEFAPVRLADADGVVHEFHFRSLLFGDQLSLEAFELVSGDEDCVGYRFQLLGDLRSDPFELLGNLVQKVTRALATRHLVEHAGKLEVAGTTVRGRIEWDSSESGHMPCVIIDGKRVDWPAFGAMLMQFEGWQFRIALVDPSDEA